MEALQKTLQHTQLQLQTAISLEIVHNWEFMALKSAYQELSEKTWQLLRKTDDLHTMLKSTQLELQGQLAGNHTHSRVVHARIGALS